jgi:hypothetical protein
MAIGWLLALMLALLLVLRMAMVLPMILPTLLFLMPTPGAGWRGTGDGLTAAVAVVFSIIKVVGFGFKVVHRDQASCGGRSDDGFWGAGPIKKASGGVFVRRKRSFLGRKTLDRYGRHDEDGESWGFGAGLPGTSVAEI